jgi:ubiquinone/menaquinone biosynthesis C-methylase UbiE
MSTPIGPRPSRGFFDLWSRVYDAPPVQRAIYLPVQDAVLGALRLAAPARLLDLGCGTGILTARLTEELPGTAVVGCDFSGGMLRQASERSRTPAWLQGDALHLALRTESVDAVTSTESFHWFPDPELALAELARVIRPGGLLLVAMVHPRSTVGTRALAASSRVLGQPGTWSTREQMRARLGDAGFEVLSQNRVSRIGAAAVPTVLTVARRQGRD